MHIILRRRKLGLEATNSIKENMVESYDNVLIVRNDRIRKSTPSAEILFRWGCTSYFPHEICINESRHRW